MMIQTFAYWAGLASLLLIDRNETDGQKRLPLTEETHMRKHMLTLIMGMAVVALGVTSTLINVEIVEAVGIDVRSSNSEVKSIPANKSGGTTLSCPEGYQVTGGGFEVWENNLVIVKNAPKGNAWEVQAFSPTTSGKIQAYIVCAKLVLDNQERRPVSSERRR